MKIICIGRNYHDHAAEMGEEVHRMPLMFMKPETALIKARLPFFYPDFSNDIHYEAELVLRICKLGKHIQTRFAHTYYQEVAVGLDFTARDLQQQCKEAGHPWEIAKSFDGSAAVSSFVPLDSLTNRENIAFSLQKNGEVVQKAHSGMMIHHFDELISLVSQFFTLKMGDYIFTGTPAGVGPVKTGDKLEAFLEEKKMLQVFIK
ncbi:MAG: fumarylacetoacetate hydrolase family protein [Bacteroidales bacterium]